MNHTIRLTLPLMLFFHLSVWADEPEHWSLRPIQSSTPPEIADSTWRRTSIDRFIVAKLEAVGLKPVADADAETVIRRVCFNLVGLPPTLELVDDFTTAYARDPTAAVEVLVDRLLDSRYFGEKWARHWLDVARFAESNGKDRDIVLPHAWRYRDYVINAFNADKPINTFIREQIAGDLLPESGDEQVVATAFLALGPKPFMERKLEKFKLDVADEQIDVLSRSILGLTIACARCHDHQFDPISTRDYYALAGILLSSDTRYGPGPIHVLTTHEKDTELVPIGSRADELHPAVVAWRQQVVKLTEEVMGMRVAANPLMREIRLGLKERGLKTPDQAPDLAKLQKRLDELKAKERVENKRRHALIQSPPTERPGYTMAMLRSEKQPIDCAIRIDGEYKQLGERVPRGELNIPGMPAFASVSSSDSGRLQLADWLAGDRNPLTARVFVNRVWHCLFGSGLVRTVDNFGFTGEEPSHPQLLDHLTAEFIADGWSLKRLVRRIVLSRTWQLASSSRPENSAADPENRMLWRANYRRLEIEQFRDAVLFVSGELTLKPRAGSLFQSIEAGFDYGDPIPGHQFNLDDDVAKDRYRTVYLPVARNRIPEFLSLFDFADPNAPSGSRNSRSIPAQALYLMNNPFMDEQARAAANRILKLPRSQRLEAAWRMATGRQPDSEVTALLESWLKNRSEADAWTDLMQVLFASAQFRYLD